MRPMILIMAICFAGCAAHLEWTSTSVAGNQCGRGCQSMGHQCKAHCFTGWACISECQMAVNECLLGCPDLTTREYLGQPVSDHDCWQLGYCDRGECVVRNGRCIKGAR